MRHIMINGEAISLEGSEFLAQNSDCPMPHYEQNLSNGQTGQFEIKLTAEQFENLEDIPNACDWDKIWVDGEEYEVQA